MSKSQSHEKVASRKITVRRKPGTTASVPEQRYRVEGIARGGRILYINVVGTPGLWHFYGSAGFRLDIYAKSVEHALRIAGRRLPFRPVVVRKV